jgi:hypothetical protein
MVFPGEGLSSCEVSTEPGGQHLGWVAIGMRAGRLGQPEVVLDLLALELGSPCTGQMPRVSFSTVDEANR